MSFMFKPLAYDEPNAFNKINLDKTLEEKFCINTKESAKAIVDDLISNNKKSLALDGYISATYEDLISEIKDYAKTKNLIINVLDMKTLYKSQKEIDELTEESLPLNYDDDPVLLFGKIYKGTIDDLIKEEAKEEITKFIEKEGINIVIGNGSASTKLRDLYDAIGYVDITPKIAAIRAREEKYVNIGDESPRPFNLLMRRNYYVDYEVSVKNRKELLLNDLIDYYILGMDENAYQMLPKELFNHVLATLVKYPFRAKPVYLEGIWGGEYIRKLRNIPMDIAGNIAWIFEFIPMEVSIEVILKDIKADIPFSTYVAKEGKKMIGEKAYKEFDGYFPIRFNYDDSWHSNGNMSIQVHPYEEFIIDNYDEFGRQDEAYYIVATGHGAKTYAGWKYNPQEFLELTERSETTNEEVDYQKYVNYVDSVPGRQIMIPAGTIHASGRNQFILELGSLTIGSYTYKIYDYNRKDKDGKQRPIHSKNAKKVLKFERDTKWVNENIAIDPVLLKEEKGIKEYLIGKTDLMYYETHRIEMEKETTFEDHNNNFTVLTLVDGEKIKITSKTNPEFTYELKYCEIATIPNTITDYIIENLGYQPCVVHKTLLRDDFKRYIDDKYYER